MSSWLNIVLIFYSFSKDYFSKYSFYVDVYLLMEKSAITGFDSVDLSTIDFLLEAMGENVGDKRHYLEKNSKNFLKERQNNNDSPVANNDYKPSNTNEELYSNESDLKFLSDNSRSLDQQQRDGELNRRNAANQSSKSTSNPSNKTLNINQKNIEREIDTEIKMVNNAMLDSMVSHIRDFFPDLSDETVQSLLTKNNYDTEKVIDYILTERVPMWVDQGTLFLQFRTLSVKTCELLTIFLVIKELL